MTTLTSAPPPDDGDPLRAFAAGLRTLRHQAGHTLRDLGKAMHYAPGYLSRIENGRIFPQWSFVEAYVLACGQDATKFRAEWEAVRDRRERDSGLAPQLGAMRRQVDDAIAELEGISAAPSAGTPGSPDEPTLKDVAEDVRGLRDLLDNFQSNYELDQQRGQRSAWWQVAIGSGIGFVLGLVGAYVALLLGWN